MKDPVKEPQVFDFLDYREFLKTWYEFSKTNKRGFSYRSFATKAGFSSPNFLKRIIDGHRNLTVDSAIRCAEAMNLALKEKEYFLLLVRFNLAETPKEKNHWFEEITQTRQFQSLKPLEADQYEYCSYWFTPALRELIVSKKFDGSIESLCRSFDPPLSVVDVKHALQVLVRLGFIKRISQKKFKQTTPIVSSGLQADSPATYVYHEQVLQHLSKRLGEVDPKRRDVSALTLGIRKDRFPELQKRIQEFRKSILQLVEKDDEPEDIVLLSIYLMPLLREDR